jgi:2-hydroxy-6-oxonona-2,4-dienedioate hydrolase
MKDAGPQPDPMWQLTSESSSATEYPPMVLLHGVFGKPTDWGACEHHFLGSCEVLAPKLPLEDASRFRNGFEHVVHHITEFLDSRGIDRVILGGNSFGGQIAMHVALRCPLRVAGLILAGSSGLFEPGYAKHVPHRPDRAWLRNKMREVFFDESHITESFIDEIKESLWDRRRRIGLVRMAAAAKRNNLRAVLHKIQSPVLLVWGANDHITPPSVAQEFKERLPLAELEFIDQCGHAPSLERPHEFNLIVERFLQRHFAALHAR